MKRATSMMMSMKKIYTKKLTKFTYYGIHYIIFHGKPRKLRICSFFYDDSQSAFYRPYHIHHHNHLYSSNF